MLSGVGPSNANRPTQSKHLCLFSEPSYTHHVRK